MLHRKHHVLRRAVTRAAVTYDAGPADPLTTLVAVGGPEFSVLTGVVLGAAAGGAPVILDGLATSVAALRAIRIDPAVATHLVAGHRSREKAHQYPLHELGLDHY